MPLLMFGAILGYGVLVYAGYRYVRSHPPIREDEATPKEIAKGD